MNNSKNNPNRRGVALLVVLVIVMAVTVLSFGYIARTDIELACGTNTLLRMQTDYLAESGLVHAKGLILNPQDVEAGFWTGAEELQLGSGDDDYYYDVSVAQIGLGQCNYRITSTGYRQKSGEIQMLGRSSLTAELRLDPCIAYWAGSATTIPAAVTINGDVYCNGNLSNNGNISGDVFAANLTGDGRLYPKDQLSVNWPGLEANDFSSQYYYTEDTSCWAQDFDPNIPLVPNDINRAGVRYCSGNMELSGNVSITGMLAVSGDLTVSGAGNVITAVKNFPALLVGGEVLVKDAGTLEINGLAVITERLRVDPNAANFSVTVSGGLFIENGGIDVETAGAGTINITAAPVKAALQTWPNPGSAARWRQAGGAFFKSIERN